MDFIELFAKNKQNIWNLSDCNRNWTHSHLTCKRILHHLRKLPKEYSLYICMDVEELLAWNKRDIWSLSDCKGHRTHNHLVCRQSLNHLAKLNWSKNWVVLWELICTVHLIVCTYHVTTRLRVNLHSIDFWMSRNSLLETGGISEV